MMSASPPAHFIGRGSLSLTPPSPGARSSPVLGLSTLHSAGLHTPTRPVAFSFGRLSSLSQPSSARSSPSSPLRQLEGQGAAAMMLMRNASPTNMSHGSLGSLVSAVLGADEPAGFLPLTPSADSMPPPSAESRSSKVKHFDFKIPAVKKRPEPELKSSVAESPTNFLA